MFSLVQLINEDWKTKPMRNFRQFTHLTRPNMATAKIKNSRDAISNIFSNRTSNLSYVVEAANWSIEMDGKYITESLSKAGLLKARTTATCVGLRNQIIHFGSVNTFVSKRGIKKVHPSNKVVLTWFHVVPHDIRIKSVPELNEKVEVVHTACQITRNKLIELGLNEEKIVVIPLGVDLSLFKAVSLKQREIAKEELRIPLDKIVIGSFQKDGVGWDTGVKPKLIKGPDIFVNVAEQLAKNYPIFVLLVGPARGYVETELRKRNVPFKSIGYLRDFKKLAKYYHLLDLYLITSRIEGGPKQPLEAWASGIPVISTKVGMLPDITTNEKDILLAEIEEVDGLVNQSEKVMNSESPKNVLIKNGLKVVQNYCWECIAKRYHKEIYSRLL